MRLLQSLHHYDVAMFVRLLHAPMHARLARFCRTISSTGNGHLYLLLAATLYISQGSDDPLLRSMLWAFALERPTYFLLKNGFKRNRPAAALPDFKSLIVPSDQFSFPSGHTSAAFMTATLIGFFIPILLLPLLIWAGLVGFSRVVLGVHFPTDTVVGMLLGTGVALFSLNQVIV